jgi:hypothetical protein
MSERIEMAVKLVVNMVAEILASRHTWNLNETLSNMTKTELYQTLADSRTELWMDNPHDIADLFDLEFAGKRLSLDAFFL